MTTVNRSCLLTCFWTVWAEIWLGARMLIDVELQILTAFKRFHANVTFVRPIITVRDFMLL